eukprot:6334025-Amphidinium_carterae.1
MPQVRPATGRWQPEEFLFTGNFLELDLCDSRLRAHVVATCAQGPPVCSRRLMPFNRPATCL